MAYGLQIKNASNQLVLEVSDRVARFVTTGSSSYTTGSSSPITVSVTGMTNDDTWTVVVNSSVAHGGIEVEKGNGSFTMKQVGLYTGQTATLRYIVIRN